ncbi:hypothetical protein [Aporhodopirellula aestuarii]|uniref:Secreted protein n=1 Tax=Aporhodopirellula aestuarii TaxID=2950107 RepID=A0ABT0U7F0_9BACT|nr:hypothetical protein [Aporhodopirellula aestuarii]MCM2372609.1 hypothetical protein [Aporhodopirellula aestuarii]
MTNRLALLLVACGLVAPLIGCSEKKNAVILATPERIDRWENYGQSSQEEYKDRASGSKAIPKS